MGIVKNIAGQRFGLLTAICIDTKYVSPGKYRGYKWICKCDCGNIRSSFLVNLLRGKTKSCGCRQGGYDNGTHGLRHLRLYTSWHSMIRRCEKSDAPCYERYGGRGIIVCESWHNIKSFYEDMGERPLNTSLDRIDNEKGYYKENCRWATSSEQANNTSRSRLISYGGQTKTIAEWSDIVGIKVDTLYGRIITRGWTIEDALTTPKLKHRYEREHRAEKFKRCFQQGYVHHRIRTEGDLSNRYRHRTSIILDG